MDAALAPALLTDLYQLAMLQAYHAERLEAPAVFELFVRKLPAHRNFLVAAGLGPLLAQLDAIAPTPEELRFLAATGRFDDRFLTWLAGLRFTGDVNALPEGTVCFPEEPIVQVIAPIAQAQLIETRLINLLHYQTVVASKAARVVLAAPDRLLVEFGLRRAHGAEAGLLSARAAYLAGFGGTSNVLAGMRYGIPIYGTMAHAYVQAHEDEADAFARFAAANPREVTLLIDTYDTEAGARVVVELARRGLRVDGVRIDSGDLAAHARAVRAILDAGGLGDAHIFASGGLDEHAVAALCRAGAPIDGFGVGTKLNTSADAPYLDCAYKLQAYAGRPRRKRSEGKATWPGRKQVWRRTGADGRMAGDVIDLATAEHPGTPLLVPVVRQGRACATPTLAEARARCAGELARLPEPLRSLEPAPPYPVEIAPGLVALAAALDDRATHACQPGGKTKSS